MQQQQHQTKPQTKCRDGKPHLWSPPQTYRLDFWTIRTVRYCVECNATIKIEKNSGTGKATKQYGNLAKSTTAREVITA